MRIAYLDCFSGISGDMFLGALLDAGVSADVFEETVAALNVGAELQISRVERSGISASKVDVLVHGEKELPREVYWEQQKAPQGSQHRPYAHAHHHHREHHHGTVHGRSLKEIKKIISAAKISDQAKGTAIRIFDTLGAAEAKIHNRDVETIHFHEVGAVDAMVDIVGAAVGAEELHVDEWVCSRLNVGGGTVKCAHGIFPVPAPATVEILQGTPIYSSGLDLELVTPTGAAIVRTLASRFGSFPGMRVQSVGYGAGTRDIPGQANVLRITVGESETVEAVTRETITVLEANLDDLSPQVFGYVLDHLLEQGALDVFGLPVQMKKTRPAVLLTVLCRPEQAAKLSQIIFAETSTLGIRSREERRDVLGRRWVAVETPWGRVRIKVAGINGTITNYAPEYEDCRKIAAEHRIPLKSVMQEATRQYLASNQVAAEDKKARNS